MNNQNSLIFLSHSNPQDNDAALWLASKLSLAGYRVWSDLTHLFGGEYFWENIEEAIRQYAAKFVVLISKNSQNSSGVQDELNLAITLERKRGIARFVIPIRLDNLPFEDFKVNIGRKNAIDFSHDWSEGFARLIECLELDNIPRAECIIPNQIANWYASQDQTPANIVDKTQYLTSNWLPIKSIPQETYFSRIPVSASRSSEIIRSFDYPAFVYSDLIGSFASNTQLQPKMPVSLFLTHAFKVRTTNLIEGDTSVFPSLKWQDGQNLIATMISDAWDRKCQTMGMLSFDLSSHSKCWFFRQDSSSKNKVRFVDSDGSTRSIQLTGKSERYNVYWHYAISVHPSFTHLKHLSLRSHVIFTFDGETPVANARRMHSLRRGFCRSWWNERWRKLLLGYLSCFSKMGEIPITAAPDGLNILLDANTLQFTSPVAILDPGVTDGQSMKQDEELDDTNTSYEPQDIDIDEVDLDLGEKDVSAQD